MTQPPAVNATPTVGGLPPNWKPDTSAFGARLALVRWRMGFNQKEAAIACGVPAASWRSWEVDGGMPRDLVAVTTQIAERTGVDRLWLLFGEDVEANTGGGAGTGPGGGAGSGPGGPGGTTPGGPGKDVYRAVAS